MSISTRSMRRATAGVVGATGVAAAVLFGAAAPAEATVSPSEVSATAVTDGSFGVPAVAPISLQAPPAAGGAVATGFQTAPMPDWWGHHRWWHHHRGWGHHWWHPWWWW